MSVHYQADERTVQELTAIFFPQCKEENLAKAATRFFLDQHYAYENPQVNLTTLRRFVDYYIQTEKN